MKRIRQGLCACLALAAAPARADLCDSVQGGATPSPTAATRLDVDFYQTLFPKDGGQPGIGMRWWCSATASATPRVTRSPP